MRLDIALIQRRLFENASVRARIVRDYGLTADADTPQRFADSVVQQLDQASVPDPLAQQPDNAAVFRAAVMAIGSNGRSWANFLKNRQQLSDLLGQYDPVHAHQAFEEGALSLNEVKSCLPGQSSTADATAIQRWAALLSQIPSYYELIRDVGVTFQVLSQERYGEVLPNSHLLLCLVGYFAGTSGRKFGDSIVPYRTQQFLPGQRKFPGMGYVLASEFLRNLRWDGFKPDRHVQRLFNRWIPGGTEVMTADAQRLLTLLDRRSADLQRYLTYALLGIAVAPAGSMLSHSDNLVWLLGAYVEKKGRESDLPYIIG